MNLEVGIFDTCMLNARLNSLASIEETIELCQLSEKLGINRYWVSDHQSVGFSSHTPEILLTILGMVTSKINLGIGGVQFNLNSPLKIAQQFKLLNTIFDNRIQLGIAKSPISEEWAVELLNGVSQNELILDHPKRLRKLISYLNKEYFYGEDQVIVEPSKGKSPEVFILGNSRNSLDESLSLNTNICFSFFHKGLSKPRTKDINNYKMLFEKKNNRKPVIGGVLAFILKDDRKLHTPEIDLENLAINQTIIADLGELKYISNKLAQLYKLDFLLFFDLTNDFNLRKKHIQKISKLFTPKR